MKILLTVKKAIPHVHSRGWVVFLLFLGSLLVACGGTRDYEEFSHRDPYMKKDDFYRDVRECETEKTRHSSKIQGREMGFKGQDTGFLGCMKLKGWEKIQP